MSVLGNIRARAVPVARQTVKTVAAAADLPRLGPVGPIMFGRGGVRGRRSGGSSSESPQVPHLGVTILIYHRVGAGNGGEIDLDPGLFDEQLAWLTANMRVLSLDAAVDELSGHAPTGASDSSRAGGPASGKAAAPDSGPQTAPTGAYAPTGPRRPGVVLTFDDGTTDWVDHVLPSLERHRVPATFYVATSFVDEQIPFPGEGRTISWAGLKEMTSSNLVTIGSHTHRHMLLDRLDDAAIDDELDRSIEMLRSRLGVAVDHFAYPKAVAGSPAAEAAVRTRFRSAVLAGTRPNHPGIDPYRLHRSPIQSSDGMVWFKRKAAGGMHFEDDLRRWANKVRYRGLSS